MLELDRILKEKGLAQNEFAAQLNLGATTLNNYIKGRRLPDLNTLCKMCDALGVSCDYMLGRSRVVTSQISEAEWQLLAAYRAANVRDRGLVDQILAAYIQTAGEGESAI